MFKFKEFRGDFDFAKEVERHTQTILNIHKLNARINQPISDWGNNWNTPDRALEPEEIEECLFEEDIDSQIDAYQLSHDPKLEGYEAGNSTIESYEDRRGK